MFAARRGPYVQPVTARWAVTVRFISSTNSQQARPSSPRRAIPVVLAPARPPRIYYIGPPPPPPRPPKRWEHTIPSAPGESWSVPKEKHHHRGHVWGASPSAPGSFLGVSWGRKGDKHLKFRAQGQIVRREFIIGVLPPPSGRTAPWPASTIT